MISLGLTSAQQQTFHRVLAGSHSVDVGVRVLDLNRRYIADVSDQLYDGQVNIDSDADVTRTATLSLRDPNRSMMFDSASPNDGALFVDRMISIVYTVSAPYPSREVYSVPLFVGPVTKVSRTADILSVEASGMEHLIIPPTVAWYAKTWAKGIKQTTLIRTILSELGGETRFSIPDWPNTTAAPVTVAYSSNIWAAAKAVAGNRAYNHLYYDGRGVAVLRKTPGVSSFDFRTGDGGAVVTEPQVSYDMTDVVNTVRVTGATLAGKKTPVTAISTAPRAHPLSTYSLGRNGKQRIILHEEQDDHLKTYAQCKALATSRVESLLREAVDVSFDALVVPHLEPEDLVTVNTPTLSMQIRIKKLSIPLKGGLMSVGYNAKRSVNVTRIRKR